MTCHSTMAQHKNREDCGSLEFADIRIGFIWQIFRMKADVLNLKFVIFCRCSQQIMRWPTSPGQLSQDMVLGFRIKAEQVSGVGSRNLFQWRWPSLDPHRSNWLRPNRNGLRDGQNGSNLRWPPRFYRLTPSPHRFANGPDVPPSQSAA